MITSKIIMVALVVLTILAFVRARNIVNTVQDPFSSEMFSKVHSNRHSRGLNDLFDCDKSAAGVWKCIGLCAGMSLAGMTGECIHGRCECREVVVPGFGP
ncbi:uncharacterized protein LOC129913572 isoform X2 [Episyrphus balteatus]|uniref:uncharacterized protein LOC129913572 isoform X2 n=1 Tax=Episyrphus balteatus TaxID=286459 RepID=UPI002486A9B9|nr:uncharacterized protein LOC129913572 isoform X2 [Episyrphus balteatus]